MVQYESYRSNAAEIPVMRRWVLGGLVLSLALHGVLFWLFYQHRLEGFGVNEPRLAPPRVFSMKRVSIPATPETADTKVTMTEKSPNVAALTIPQDKPEVSEISFAPQHPDLKPEQFMEKPKVDPTGLDKLAKTDAATRAEMDKELNAISQNLIKERPVSARQPVIAVASGKGAGGGEGSVNLNIPGMANIDDMLAKSGSLHAGEKAGMPGGALFEYDSFDLRADALEQLRKLGTLIQKNPRATFSIEGHTDSFGSPEYNQKLSEARAESVKNWLVMNFQIPPARIQTKGFGNTKPIVPAEKSREEQAPNRRVELVVKTNR